MRLLIKILLVVWILIEISGCKGTSTVSHEVTNTDSTGTNNVVKENRFDSAYYKQEVIAKKLEAARADLVFTKEQVIALLHQLETMPKGTTIIKHDPKLQALLSIVMDSLGNYRFRCESAERMYNETIITQSRVIETLKDQLAEKERIIKQSETEVLQAQDPWYKRFWHSITNSITLIVIIAALVLGLILVIKFK